MQYLKIQFPPLRKHTASSDQKTTKLMFLREYSFPVLNGVIHIYHNAFKKLTDISSTAVRLLISTFMNPSGREKNFGTFQGLPQCGAQVEKLQTAERKWNTKNNSVLSKELRY
jgi:hypothetical protein